jgi:hypothetical protein
MEQAAEGMCAVTGIRTPVKNGIRTKGDMFGIFGTHENRANRVA